MSHRSKKRNADNAEFKTRIKWIQAAKISFAMYLRYLGSEKNV